MKNFYLSTVFTKKNIQLFLFFFLFSVFCLLLYIFLSIVYDNSTNTTSSPYYFQEAQKLSNKCKTQKDKKNCYGILFSQLVRKSGLMPAYQSLLELQGIDLESQSCHAIAHKIGREAVLRNPEHWIEDVKKINLNMCAYGFFHGAIEGYTSINPDFVLNENTIPSLCRKMQVISSRQIEQGMNDDMCVHISGHILLVQNDASIPRALKACSGLSDNLIQYCALGVFMENNSRETLSDHGLGDKFAWNEENTLKQEQICIEYSGKYSQACWNAMAYMYVNLARGDHVKLSELCNRAQQSLDHDACYLQGASLAGMLMMVGRIESHNLVHLCDTYSRNFHYLELCIKSVVTNVVNSVPLLTSKFIPFCLSQQEKYQPLCFHEMGKGLSMVVSARQQKEQCKDVPQEYKNLCTTGIIRKSIGEIIANL